MSLDDREDAIIILTEANKLPNKPPNKPMKQHILDAAQRIIVRNPEVPPPATVTSIAIAPVSMNLHPDDTVALSVIATKSDGTTEPVTAQAAFHVTAGGGSVDSAGVYTAGATLGNHVITATYGTHLASADVAITATEPPDPVGVLFEDTFATGALAPEQNGVKWQALSFGTGDQVFVTTGALVHRFKGSTSLTDDAWCESNLKLPDLEAVFIGAEWETTAEYFHRTDPNGPDNNKLLRMFGGPQGATRDQAYSGKLSIGMSVNPGSTGESWLSGEYKKPDGSGMGAWGLGPNVKILVPGVNRIRLAQYGAVGSGLNTGTSRIWFNGNLIYDHNNLPLWVDGQYNRFQYAYLPGWSNSGFNVDTDLRLLRIVIAREPIPDFTTP